MRIVVASGGGGDGDARAARYRRCLRALPGVDLVDVSPDAVVVCGEPSLHRELTELAAAAGAHVLCEPPLAGRVADAEAMIDVCSRAGVSLTLACPARFGPAFDAVREAVADGRLGQLSTVNGTCHPDWAPHLVDLVDLLLDGEPAEEVYAQASTVAPASVVVVRYPGGTVATWGHGYGATRVELVGDRGTVRFDPLARLLDVRSAGRDGEHGTGRDGEHGTGRDGDHGTGRDGDRPGDHGTGCGGGGAADLGAAVLDAAMLGAFVAGVRDGWPTGPDGAAGLRGLRIARAAHRSLGTGRPEPVGHRPGDPR
ncbi:MULTISPECIES: Gfo/Idh/MocA family oxidoreductase [unclassified Micromonospora]|uniref:Gfo/Idh/MocA family oxidoreductase n=1 Tax=unclassified Micromonospora TaxID=2617518 RepID=UPI003640B066